MTFPLLELIFAPPLRDDDPPPRRRDRPDRKPSEPARMTGGGDRLRGLPLAEIVARVRAGDVSAIQMVHEAYAQRLLDYAYVHLADRQTAEDVVQDVFVALWVGRATL